MNKPFKSYNGGKESDGTYQKIINLMPPHDIYIEAFLGNGAIYRNKKPAFISSIGIDLDTAVIRQWRLSGLSDLTRPKGITLINADAISWLEHFSTMAAILKKMDVRVLLYLDPPYPKSTWKSQAKIYDHEMTDDEHRSLLSTVINIQHECNIVISSYPNDLYSDVLDNWNTIEFTAMTRGGTATEKVWYNYPPPVELHDYRYLGSDYRERENIKAIITRNVAKFKRLPDLHRNAIIHSLKNDQIL